MGWKAFEERGNNMQLYEVEFEKGVKMTIDISGDPGEDANEEKAARLASAALLSCFPLEGREEVDLIRPVKVTPIKDLTITS